MAKFRLPNGSVTREIIIREDGDVVKLRFNKKGEAQCADKYVHIIKKHVPNLELIEEESE
jgi:hypothetical protein